MKQASVFADNELTSWADAHAVAGGEGGFEFTVDGVLNFARAIDAAMMGQLKQ